MSTDSNQSNQPAGTLNRWSGFSFLAGAAMAACFVALIPLPNLRGAHVTQFLTYFILASGAYFLAVYRQERDRLPLRLIWAFAILFRLILLFAQPSLSDDIYRYIWDGHLLNQGANPYALPVNSPLLDSYAIPQREMVNHDWMASPYLPAAQFLFFLLARVAPGNLLAFQAAAALLDLSTGWLVMDLLRILGLPRQRVLIYLWNPLVVVEFTHAAHIDAWMIFLALLAFWLLARSHPKSVHQGKWMSASAISLATSTLTKVIPVILAPLFFRRWGWKRVVLHGFLVMAGILAFVPGAGWGLSGPLDGTGVFGALRIYSNYWNFNSSIYHWLEVALTGYQTAGAAPFEPPYEDAIRLARLITTALMGLVLMATALLAWRLDDPMRAGHQPRTRDLLRLAMLPIGAYLLLTPTIHPWYAAFILPFIPFLLPAQGESPDLGRFVWPWLYLTCALAFSYVTYIDLDKFHEYAFVRAIEYLPFFLLMLWAGWPYLKGRLQQREQAA